MTPSFDPDEMAYEEGIRTEVNFFVATAQGFKAHIKMHPLAGMPVEAIRAQAKSSIATLDALSEIAIAYSMAPDQYRAAKPPESPQEGQETAQPPEAVAAVEEPTCPYCGGRVWDNRESKRSSRAPDFKCRDKSCDAAHVINL